MSVQGQTFHYSRRNPKKEIEVVKVKHRPKKSIFGLLIQCVAQLLIFGLFFYACQLGLEAQHASDEFYASTATGWMSWFSMLTNWARYWVIALALVLVTLFSWPFHGLVTKLVGSAPLAYGLYQVWQLS